MVARECGRCSGFEVVSAGGAPSPKLHPRPRSSVPDPPVPLLSARPGSLQALPAPPSLCPPLQAPLCSLTMPDSPSSHHSSSLLSPPAEEHPRMRPHGLRGEDQLRRLQAGRIQEVGVGPGGVEWGAGPPKLRSLGGSGGPG